MKTIHAKFWITLLFVLGSCTAFAEESKDTDSRDSHVSPSNAECTGELISACGMKVVKTACTGNSISAQTSADESDDTSHLSKEKDTDNKNDHDYYVESHKDHSDRSKYPLGNKLSICHRMGGVERTLLVTNDGWLSGHSKHDLDTIGRCSDFDAAKLSDDLKTDSDKDHKVSASDTGYSMGLTTTQIACLKGSPGQTFTINGTPYPGAGLNSSNFAISFQSPTQGPSRGGARTLR